MSLIYAMPLGENGYRKKKQFQKWNSFGSAVREYIDKSQCSFAAF